MPAWALGACEVEALWCANGRISNLVTGLLSLINRLNPCVRFSSLFGMNAPARGLFPQIPAWSRSNGSHRMRRFLASGMLGLAASISLADDVTVPAVEGNGTLTWSNSAATGSHAVEWASSPTGAWHRDWHDLIDLPATGGTTTVDMPRYCRVVWNTNSVGIVVTNEQIGVGTGTRFAFDALLAHPGIVPGTVIVSGRGAYVTDLFSTNRVLTGSLTSTGYVTYITGAVGAILSPTPTVGVPVTVSYKYRNPPPYAVAVEQIGTGTGSRSTFSGQLSHAPIISGSVMVGCPGIFGVDLNSDQVLTGRVVGVVDYSSGHVDVTCSVPPPVGVAVLVYYAYESPTP